VTGAPLHILVVDDEPGVRSALVRYLGGEGFQTTECADGAALRAALERGPVDLILMDLMMPGEDGLALARLVRSRSSVPIIMLTGKGDVIDRVAGLEAGADDYIAKPFHLREVLARIRTVLRRAPAADGPAGEAPPEASYWFDGWCLDPAHRRVVGRDGRAVPLTSGEFDLLAVFVQHANRVLTRDRLMTLLKGREWSAYDRAIDTQVRRLRKRLGDDGHEPALIKTVRGSGYLFAARVTRAGTGGRSDGIA
jgi:two-component system OmpR family response regulator